MLSLTLSIPTQTDTPEALYVWNVGQGSWATFVVQNQCMHFDMGGERAPWAKIKNLCANKLNTLRLSHSDKDHLSFAAIFSRRIAPLCIVKMPLGSTKSKFSSNVLKRLPVCSQQKLFKHIDEVRFKIPDSFKSANDKSRIYELYEEFLFPGDSTLRAEKVWAKSISKSVRVLLLGHHGSKTSTSQILLQNLIHLKQAIASSRKRVYGHPHQDVILRLKNKGVAVLRTEDWGNIKFSINKF